MKITEDNIEVLLFDYAEGKLEPQMQKELEEYLESNPQYKELISIYKENETVEMPLDIVFEDKDKMFEAIVKTKAQKTLVIPAFVKWASAIAALIVLFFTIRALIPNEQMPIQIAQNNTERIITKNPEIETKIEENKTKNQSTETKKEFTETKKNFVFVIEEENDSIIHQLAFQEIELASAEIEKQERILYMRYEESIMVKKVSKPSLASRIVKSIGLEEKIEEFYNSDFVSNTRNAINTARSLGKKQVKTTTTTIKREESINV